MHTPPYRNERNSGEGKAVRSVPLYFFHMVARAYRIDDAFGMDFPDLATAGQHAVRIARDLMDETGFGGGWHISVTDGGDQKLLEVGPDGAIREIGHQGESQDPHGQ
jgi:hypothetical protein